MGTERQICGTYKIKGADESREDNSAVQNEAPRDDRVLGNFEVPEHVHGYQDSANDNHGNHRS